MGLAALSALVGLKYLLFFGVVLLGLGKVLARLTSWTINTACQGEATQMVGFLDFGSEYHYFL